MLVKNIGYLGYLVTFRHLLKIVDEAIPTIITRRFSKKIIPFYTLPCAFKVIPIALEIICKVRFFTIFQESRQ